ncbi:MAG: hypothetical protein ACTHJW_13665, partial [Streptosporangiaceae bacterium]
CARPKNRGEGQLRLANQNFRTVMIILGLNLLATALCATGYMLGKLDPAAQKRNDIPWADEVSYSFRHLRFDRYLLAGVVIILLISLIPQQVSRWATSFSFASLQVSGVPIGFLAFPVLFIIFDRSPSLSMFIPLLLGCLFFLVSSLIPFFSRDGKDHAIRVYDRFGFVAPTLFAAAIVLYALVLFAWIGSFLSVHNWVSISGTDGTRREDLGFYIAAFGYEAAKAIPVIDVGDTFQWKAPYSHSGIPAGMLILMFRVAVLTPVVGFYGAYWSHVRESRKARPVPATTLMEAAPAPSVSEPEADRSRQHPEPD